MRTVLAAVIALHALVHGLGFLKAFGLADLPRLMMPISRLMGVVWLASAVLLLVAAVLLRVAPRRFWLVGAVGLVLSQVAIAASWSDAHWGTLANLLVLATIVHGLAAWGPAGLRSEYESKVARGIARLAAGPVVTDADLSRLPAPVARYLRFAGVVGQPRPAGFRARFTGRIRGGPGDDWMPFVGEQHSFLEPPTRLFWMHAVKAGLPVDVLHAYEGQGARMRVRLLSLAPMVDHAGPDFARTETVTVFNDLCVMAPAALADPAIAWREIDDHQAEATWTNGAYTIRATLVFGDDGALVDFRSDDRPALAPDGKSFLRQRWSTPLRDYRQQGPVRLASKGEARYAAPSGEYAYIEFDGLEVSYDLGRK